MTILQNNPLLWRDKLPVHNPAGHKYDRGIAVICGAPEMTGATRLAARACARMGAGLVKVLAPEGTAQIYRTTLHEEIIVEEAGKFTGFGDARIKSFLTGSGMRKEDVDVSLIEAAMKAGHVNIVLDAGAFAAWNGRADAGRMVATPHEGEFAARFGKMEQNTKEERAHLAFETIGATIVLKGAQTVVCGEGEAVIQDREVPALATAGTGDVLAGMITGLLAQGMDTKWACAAAIWIHAEAAERFGAGLVASDLPEMIPAVLRDL